MFDSSTSNRRGSTWLVLGVLLVLGPALVWLGVAPAAAGETDEHVSVYRATNESVEDVGPIQRSIGNGTFEPADRIVAGDTLVVTISSDRLTETMNESNGSATTRFFAALDGDAEFRIVQTNPTPQRNPIRAILGPANVTAYQDKTTVYAVVDTGDLNFVYHEVNEPVEIYGGERFAFQFGYGLSDDLSRETTPDTPVVEFVDPDELTTTQTTTRTTTTTAARQKETTTTAATTSATTTRPGTTTQPGTTRRTTTATVGTVSDDGPIPGFGLLAGVLGATAAAALRARRTERR
ncbi:hypothetical protein [Haloarchaeobius sp. HME9146]|uniref:hypothetical protein n=1 Tax=Haloarchaeobius sp. HME9146 TaxID=2978732 RepID=UPI0021C0E485|nr:hypothetical protein [Haloarchaeobius sp. HME9146]MCT9095928.1 hypothetical protein [Haloarchaeobius sp. HME9146]